MAPIIHIEKMINNLPVGSMVTATESIIDLDTGVNARAK